MAAKDDKIRDKRWKHKENMQIIKLAYQEPKQSVIFKYFII